MENADDDDNANEGWKSNTELLNLIELSINENPSMEVYKKINQVIQRMFSHYKRKKVKNERQTIMGCLQLGGALGGHIEEKSSNSIDEEKLFWFSFVFVFSSRKKILKASQRNLEHDVKENLKMPQTPTKTEVLSKRYP